MICDSFVPGSITELEATKLRNCFAVRPLGRCGTVGWLADGRSWTVVYVKAPNEKAAVAKAFRQLVYGLK